MIGAFRQNEAKAFGRSAALPTGQNMARLTAARDRRKSREPQDRAVRGGLKAGREEYTVLQLPQTAMVSYSALLSVLPLLAGVNAAAVDKRQSASFAVTGGTKVAIRDAAPVGISCVKPNFEVLSDDIGMSSSPSLVMSRMSAPPLNVSRISMLQLELPLEFASAVPLSMWKTSSAADTRDRASYDPSLTTPVKYTVPSAGAAPNALTYGPSFFDLAGALKGPTTVGFNRQKANLTNVIAAAQQASSRMPNLDAFELGNEPECKSLLVIVTNRSLQQQ